MKLLPIALGEKLVPDLLCSLHVTKVQAPRLSHLQHSLLSFLKVWVSRGWQRLWWRLSGCQPSASNWQYNQNTNSEKVEKAAVIVADRGRTRRG